jgi:hypothetical protein
MSHFNYNKQSHIFKRYWNVCYCDAIECAIAKDGQLFIFSYYDIDLLLNEYPAGRLHWYFNATKDRAIAELNSLDMTVTVNPQFCYNHFKEILI